METETGVVVILGLAFKVEQHLPLATIHTSRSGADDLVAYPGLAGVLLDSGNPE
jgi:hypothetical protein